MLRRRNKSAADSKEKMRSSAFFNVPGLFVGFTGKGLFDCDSVNSPTSTLDHRPFSNINSSFVPSLRSPGKSWDCSRVGLGLVDSLTDEGKSILLGSKMRIVNIPRPKTTNLSSNMERWLFSSFGSYEKTESWTTDTTQQIYHNLKPSSDYFVSESKSSYQCSLPNFASGSLPFLSRNSINGFMGSLSASEIEFSEDYTCIISHGPNPKTTHIFGDCILENYSIEPLDSKNKQEENKSSSHWVVQCLENMPSLPSNDFMNFCFFCNKKLEDGKDIFMYRGEMAFCSCSCREEVMLMEEDPEMEKPESFYCDSLPSSSFFQEMAFHY